MKHLGTFFILISLTVGLIKADKLETKQIPADTDWIIHLDISKFRNSDMGKFAIGEIKKSGTEEDKREYNAFVAMTKYNPIDHTNSLTVFGNGANEEKVTAILKGQFDINLLLTLAKAEKSYKEEKLGKHTFFSIKFPGENETIWFFVIDKSSIAVGPNKKAISRVINTISGKLDNLNKANPNNLYIPKTPQILLGTANLKAMEDVSPNAEMFKKAKMLTIFMTETPEKNWETALKLKTANKETAQQMDSIIKGIIALNQISDEAIDLLNNVKSNADKDTLKVSFKVPVKRLIELSKEDPEKIIEQLIELDPKKPKRTEKKK